MVVGLCTSLTSVGLCRKGEIWVVQDLVLDQLKKVRIKTVWAEVGSDEGRKIGRSY